MGKLAVSGGKPLRTKAFPKWPIFDEREKQTLIEVLESGKWGVIDGTKVHEFEEKFAKFQDAKYGICTTSGTTALEIALRSCGVGAGDEVIVPSYTFIATATSAIALGAIPVFVDIEADTYNIDPTKIEAAITERTKAIVPVHIAGRPADMDGILEVARRRGLKVIEDACQAPAAEWKGRKVGAIGDIGAISFQASKNINAGEGGIILTNDERLADLAWSYHNCGRVRKGAWYEHHVIGWNYRMTEFQGAILLAQLSRLPEQTRKRSENAEYLTKLLREVDGISPMRDDDRITQNAYHLYIMRYQKEDFCGAPKKAFLKALNAEGIPCGPGYVPLYKEKAILQSEETFAVPPKLLGIDVDYSKVLCPVCERACYEEAIWLKQNILLGSKKDMEDIAGAIEKIKENANELRDIL
ncbi:MAG: DegT/DnrJ/EryC1/StrS family aminotransferase [bacterium]